MRRPSAYAFTIAANFLEYRTDVDPYIKATEAENMVPDVMAISNPDSTLYDAEVVCVLCCNLFRRLFPVVEARDGN